jgi:hypothetical protein
MQHLAQSFVVPGGFDMKSSTLDTQNYLQSTYGLSQAALEPAHGGNNGFTANWQVRLDSISRSCND